MHEFLTADHPIAVQKEAGPQRLPKEPRRTYRACGMRVGRMNGSRVCLSIGRSAAVASILFGVACSRPEQTQLLLEIDAAPTLRSQLDEVIVSVERSGVAGSRVTHRFEVRATSPTSVRWPISFAVLPTNAAALEPVRLQVVGRANNADVVERVEIATFEANRKKLVRVSLSQQSEMDGGVVTDAGLEASIDGASDSSLDAPIDAASDARNEGLADATAGDAPDRAAPGDAACPLGLSECPNGCCHDPWRFDTVGGTGGGEHVGIAIATRVLGVSEFTFDNAKHVVYTTAVPSAGLFYTVRHPEDSRWATPIAVVRQPISIDNVRGIDVNAQAYRFRSEVNRFNLLVAAVHRDPPNPADTRTGVFAYDCNDSVGFALGPIDSFDRNPVEGGVAIRGEGDDTVIMWVERTSAGPSIRSRDIPAFDVRARTDVAIAMIGETLPRTTAMIYVDPATQQLQSALRGPRATGLTDRGSVATDLLARDDFDLAYSSGWTYACFVTPTGLRLASRMGLGAWDVVTVSTQASRGCVVEADRWGVHILYYNLAVRSLEYAFKLASSTVVASGPSIPSATGTRADLALDMDGRPILAFRRLTVGGSSEVVVAE